MPTMPDRVALITGGGTGIGQAVALAIAEVGFAVALTGRRSEPLEKSAALIEARGQRAMVVPADITDPAATKALFSRVESEWGRLDLLFNNAGASARAVPMEDLAIEEWRAVFDVNVTGAFLCTQEALRIMKRQSPKGGRIINNGSISAHVPRPLSAPYTASKHAISGLTKATALDGRPFNIACGQIDIGNAATSIGSHVSSGALQADGSRLVEPLIDVKLIADAVCYMARLPLEANVLTMTVMATGMPYVGRG